MPGCLSNTGLTPKGNLCIWTKSYFLPQARSAGKKKSVFIFKLRIFDVFQHRRRYLNILENCVSNPDQMIQIKMEDLRRDLVSILTTPSLFISPGGYPWTCPHQGFKLYSPSSIFIHIYLIQLNGGALELILRSPCWPECNALQVITHTHTHESFLTAVQSNVIIHFTISVPHWFYHTAVVFAQLTSLPYYHAH